MQTKWIIAVVLICLLAVAGLYLGLRPPGREEVVDRPTARSPDRPSVPIPPDPPYQGPTWFCDVTAEAGIDFHQHSGDSSEKPFPSANGSGLAALDYDLDGLHDLYFVTGTDFPIDLSQTSYRNRCFRNLGGWRFKDVTDCCGLEHNGYSHGVAVGDYDGDGFPDVYVSCYGANCLFHNCGDGTFHRVELAAHVAHEGWAGSSAFFDHDNDGFLDLYVCNYGKWSLSNNPYCGDPNRGVRLFCSPRSVKADPDVFYRNNGNGTFRERTEESGLACRDGRALGVLAADLNEDGLIDLYVTNDLHANSLFLNEGAGRFRDASEFSGTAYDSVGSAMSSMGVDAADINGNGRLDVVVTHFQQEYNVLYRNGGQGLFQDVSAACGIGAPSLPFVGWGVVFADFDMDGWPDLAVTNGHVDDNRAAIGQSVSLSMQPMLMRNSKGRFDEVRAAEAGTYFTAKHGGRGLCMADLDNDGDQDLALNHRDGAAAVLRNDRAYPQSGKRRSLVVRLVGTRSNRDAIGSLLTFTADGRTQVVQVLGGGMYQSARDLRQFFAILPGERDLVLEIRWPNGDRSTLSGLLAGQSVVVIEPRDSGTAPQVYGIEERNDGVME